MKNTDKLCLKQKRLEDLDEVIQRVQHGWSHVNYSVHNPGYGTNKNVPIQIDSQYLIEMIQREQAELKAEINSILLDMLEKKI